jgi:glucose 1-dehydrogenase
VFDETQVQDMFSTMVHRLGTIDILVNNAGRQRDAPFGEMTLARWNTVISVNLTGQFLCARAAIVEFLRQGLHPEVSSSAGKIICMSSVHQEIPWAGHCNYAVSKGGIMMLMKSIAQEFARVGSASTVSRPGRSAPPINSAAWETKETYAALMRLVPYRRIGEPEDIGRAAVWLFGLPPIRSTMWSARRFSSLAA